MCVLALGAGWKLPGRLLCSERPGAGVAEAARAPERGGHPEEQSHHGEPEQRRQHQRAELRGEAANLNLWPRPANPDSTLTLP